MSLIVDEPGRETLLVEVPLAPVPAVEALGVQPVQAVHPGRQTLAPRFDQEVIVRAHQTPCVELPAEQLDTLLEEAPKRFAVEIVSVDERACNAA